MAVSDLYCDPVYGFEIGILGEEFSSVLDNKVLSSDQQLSPVYSPDSNRSLPFLSPSRCDECDNEIIVFENQTEEVSNIDNDMSSEDFSQFIPKLFDSEYEWLLNTLSEDICRPSTSDIASVNKAVTEMSIPVSVGNVGMSLSSVPAGFDATALLLPLQFATNQLVVGLENPSNRGKVAMATENPSATALPSQNPHAVVATTSYTSNVLSSYSSSSSESQRKRSSNIGAIIESSNKNKMTAKRRRTSEEKRPSYVYDDYEDEPEEDDGAYEPTADKSRNAINAKLNREKKKAYIADLERKVTHLRGENGKLTSEVDRANAEKEACVREVQYLRNILVNQSTLAKLLAGLPEIQGVHLRSSLFTTATDAGFHGNTEPQSVAGGHQLGRNSTSSSSRAGGICLHIDGSRVSVELCSTCANMAAQ